MLPFLTTLAITTIVWKELREGHLTRLPRAPGSFAERLPKTRLRRATWIGLLCLVVIGPIVAAGVLLFDYGDIPVSEFVIYKTIFGVVLGVDRDAADRDGRIRRRAAARGNGLEKGGLLPATAQPRRGLRMIDDRRRVVEPAGQLPRLVHGGAVDL